MCIGAEYHLWIVCPFLYAIVTITKYAPPFEEEGIASPPDKEKTNSGNAKEKTNNGLHLGWYKRADHPNYPGEIPPGWEPEEEFRAVHYVNDINTTYPEVLMVSNAEGDYTASYLYGIERIMAENVDGLQPERFDPLYYLYDGLGSATQLVNGEGEVWNILLCRPFGNLQNRGQQRIRHRQIQERVLVCPEQQTRISA